MITNYFMKHISYHLHTFVKSFTMDKIPGEAVCARKDFSDLPFSILNVRDTVLEMKAEPFPTLTSVNDSIIYAAVPARDMIYVIGPVGFHTKVNINRRIQAVPIESDWIQSLSICDFDDFMQDILLIYNLFHEEMLTAGDIIKENCVDSLTQEQIQKNFSELIFENHENRKKHNPYDQEVREFSSIENGDIRQLEQSWAEDYTGQLGTLAKDQIRSFKNVCIVVITLASRAAIRGGLNPEISFSLSDIFIMKIEESNDIATLIHIRNSAEYEYTRLVQEIKERQKGKQKKEKNPRIEACRNYIFSHLHEKISIGDMALELQMNPNYLSDLFKKEEGISVTNYIRNEKVKLAENLLIYSKYHYIEISAYLGFSSQSHLGKQFKEVTGMTLKQYRDCYGVKEFIHTEKKGNTKAEA
ncbi:AraC family transcriptional regulator [Lacrimispora defluvii]|uniref:AraC family transcriptional regulator n=1 Tax=Lacrimispora defluvii TaxID=2719233 RepID=A0ABX1VSV6_9FIRM|nr:helix-turn-helix domain-containing protein [Lacrimispora defluvii]NNJ29386.1 AraC family transcriptional regulator [Lacrimispora defluvii]